METTDLSRYDNTWYRPGRNLFVRGLWYLTNVLVLMNPLNPFSGIRKMFLRLFGAKIGKGVCIKPGVNVKYPWRLTVGSYTWIGENAWIDNLDEVHIGQHVCISQGALLLCGNHDYKSSTFDLVTGKITIGDGAWIGAKAVVGPGVNIGRMAVLAVGSVTGTDLEEGNVYRGNPAEFIRERKTAK